MKIAKYILSIFLIMGGLGLIAQKNFISGLFTLILSAILLPPVSSKIKKQFIVFQDKKIRYGIYISLFIITGIFIPKSESESFGSKEDVLINYIKNNKTDKSLQNIRTLIEIGKMFDNKNYSTTYPQKGYITEQYDSIKKVSILKFNPKFDYTGLEDIHFLKDDTKNGRFKNYTLQYEVDSKDNIILKKTTITFSKVIKEFLTVNDIPSIDTFIDDSVINRQKIKIAKEEKISNELKKFKEVMGNDDFWNTYDPIVKKRIYELIINKDCKGLQEEFNIASDRMDVKHSQGRKANRELSLVDFIDNKMRKIGCY